MHYDVRVAVESDFDALANIWNEGWHYAHAERVPKKLVKDRTRSNFRKRLAEFSGALRTIGPVGAPLGLCVARRDEIYQMFVAPSTRGTGVAARLLADGERKLAEEGTKTAFLACVIDNNQAARFYEKYGWIRTGVSNEPLEISTGIFFLECWRYEKELSLIE